MNMQAQLNGTMNGEDSLQLERSVYDNRAYRYLELNNGLKAILVSTESEYVSGSQPKAAAALCVECGSFSDPPTAHGLSHLLEHVIMTGSDKYPDVNCLSTEIEKQGGNFSSWTSNEHTLFSFNIAQPKFQETLYCFASHFTAPLMHAKYLDREIDVIQKEFETAARKDIRPIRQLIGLAAKVDSPFRKFGQGNKYSLKQLPESQKINVHELLKKHHQVWYSADRMAIAICSSDSLDALEEMVRNSFSTIPNSKKPVPDFSKFVNCFDTPQFHQVYQVIPRREKEQLRLVWELPCLHAMYASIPLAVFTSLIQNEGPGGLVAQLRALKLGSAVNCSVGKTCDFQNSSINSIFIIVVTLTKTGTDNLNEVCGVVMAYLNMLRAKAEADQNGISQQPDGQTENHTFSSYLHELQQLQEINFRFRATMNADETVTWLAGMIQRVPVHDVYCAYELMIKPDLGLYIDLLQRLTPERVGLYHISSQLANQLRENGKLQVEPWFGTSYSTEAILPATLSKWKQSKMEQFHLPQRNKFVAERLTLLPGGNDMKEPIDLNTRANSSDRHRFGQLWYQQCTKFKKPVAIFLVRLETGVDLGRRENAALNQMLKFGLEQMIEPLRLECIHTGFGCYITEDSLGLVLAVHGFTDKFCLFFEAVLDKIMEFETKITTENLESYRKLVREDQVKIALKPRCLQDHLAYFLLCKQVFLPHDIVAALERLTVGDLIAYRQRFFAQLRFVCFAYGNLTTEEALRLYDHCVERIKCSPLRRPNNISSTELQPGSYRLRVVNKDITDRKTYICRVHLLGLPDLKASACNQLLSYILQEPLKIYTQLPELVTSKAELFAWSSYPAASGHEGLTLLAHSESETCPTNRLSSAMAAFWRRVVPAFIESLNEDEYRSAVRCLIDNTNKQYHSIETDVKDVWNEILVSTNVPTFNRKEKLSGIIAVLTKQDLSEFFQTYYLNADKQRTLLIQVDPTEEVGTLASRQNVQNPFFINLQVIPSDASQNKIESKMAEDMSLDTTFTELGIESVIQNNTNTTASLQAEPIKSINNVYIFKSRLSVVPTPTN